MARDRGQSRDNGQAEGIRIDVLDPDHGDRPFGDVHKERYDAGTDAQDAEHVCRPEVSRSAAPDVNAFPEFPQPVPGGNRPDQVRQERERQIVRDPPL